VFRYAHLACVLALTFLLEAHLSRQSRLTNLYSGYFFTSMLMTWLPMKPHPPAARSARRQQAHTGRTEAAAVSGRGRFCHHIARRSRSNFPRTRARAHARARTHTHTTCKEDVFRLELTAHTHTHTPRTYTPHTRTASPRQHPNACTMTSSAQPLRAPALARRGRTPKGTVALRRSLPFPTPSPLRHSRVSRHHNAPTAALRVVGKSCGKFGSNLTTSSRRHDITGVSKSKSEFRDPNCFSANQQPIPVQRMMIVEGSVAG
jgi:hypothetical protein